MRTVRVQDPGSGRVSRTQDPARGINTRDPQHCYYYLLFCKRTIGLENNIEINNELTQVGWVKPPVPAVPDGQRVQSLAGAHQSVSCTARGTSRRQPTAVQNNSRTSLHT
jgi:hypothetical protein